MSLLLKLKERFSDKQIETNNIVNEYVEEIVDEIKNKGKDTDKENGKAVLDIDIQALANALQYTCNFNYSRKPLYLHNKNPEMKRIKLDKNIIIETVDSHIINYDNFIERMLPAIELRIIVDDIKVKFLVLKRNINYKWEIEHQNDLFPMSLGVINFIDKWSKSQLNKERKAKELEENKKKEEQQEKLDKLSEVYKEYKKYEK